MDIEPTKRAGLFHRINWRPVRFVQLFIFLMLVILLAPLLGRTPLLTALLSVLFLNTLAVCLSFAGFDVRRRWHLIALWLLGLLLDWAAARIGHPGAAMSCSVASDLVNATLLIVCVVMILRYVFKSHEVTLDTIFGALVAYFLIALTFSSLYQAVVIYEPASFSFPAAADGWHVNSLKTQLNYFSFVTIATVGYGDIVPRLPVTQMLAILEAVIGQFYMAGLIAWLVSVYARRDRGAGKPGSDAKERGVPEAGGSQPVGVKHAVDKK